MNQPTDQSTKRNILTAIFAYVHCIMNTFSVAEMSHVSIGVCALAEIANNVVNTAIMKNVNKSFFIFLSLKDNIF